MKKLYKPVNDTNIVEIAGILREVGIKVGCWYSGQDSGFFDSGLEGPCVAISNANGFVYVENNEPNRLASALVRRFEDWETLLEKERKMLEAAIRYNNHGIFTRLIELHLSDGWIVGPPPDDLFIEGTPSRYYREKPTENGNGWWAGDKLVFEYATPEEASSAFQKARNWVLDRLRNEPVFLLSVVNGEAPAPEFHW